MNGRLVPGVAGLVAALLLAGCGGYDTTVVPEPEAPPAATPAPPVDCNDDFDEVVRSYAPDSGPVEGPAVRQIRQAGRLVAGVAGDTELLGSRNPDTNQLEGFDIELAEAISREIFGDDRAVEFRVITAADRIPLLESGEIDIVARNMTITCARWEQIDFSAVYYEAAQSLLVGKGSGIASVEDLDGRRVCASAGTTTIDRIREVAPGAEIVTAPDNSRCMVRFQNGDADAVTSDDTVLAGLAAQDPYATVLTEVSLSREPYGIGVADDRVDLVRLVNQVLEDMRADGRWKAAYDRTLGTLLGPGAQPQPLYGPR